jgi:H+-transporting ATPase
MLEITIAPQFIIGERMEAAMITALIVLNVALGLFEEERAIATLVLLKHRLAPRVHVRRT